jgi:hypothetical protein
VGMMEKTEHNEYMFMHRYNIVDHGKWKTKNGPDWVSFSHELSSKDGRSYLHEKKITLRSNVPGFDLWHKLTNTGKLPIDGTTYNHNFIMIDGDLIGKNYTMEFPFPVKMENDLKGSSKIEGNTVKMIRDLQKREGVFSAITGFDHVPAHHGVTIRNIRTGAGLKIHGDIGLKEFCVFMIDTAICPEPIVEIRLKPGEKMEWTASYDIVK